MSCWVVGVDAGGTNTRAAAADLETGVIHRGRAEGANWTAHGPDLCRKRIAAAVSAALPSEARPRGVCLCIAGYYPPDHEEMAERWAREMWPGVPVRIVPDVVGAWAGALGGEPGIVLISGTGSICYGRNGEGQEARAGGWGPLFGDQGSAYWAALAALRALAEEVDGIRPASALGERLLARWPELGTDLRGWLRGVYRLQWGREQVAEIATEVAGAADAGDAAAVEILDGAAGELARQARAVERRLKSDNLPLALHGGLAESSPPIRRGVETCLRESGSGLRLTPGRFSGLEGALLLAAEGSAVPGAAQGLRRHLEQGSARGE
jgi:N-acetylglucosamine kinase-like BadF-type ATPase